MNTEEARIVENDEIVYKIENGLLLSEFKLPIKMDLNRTKSMIEMRHEISNGEKQLWLCDFKGLKGFTKEGRDYAEAHGQEYLHATAVIVNSSVVKYIANLWNKLKKPHVPMMVFTDKLEAEKWLRNINV